MIRYCRFSLFALAVRLLAQPACVPVTGEQITGQDLARADSAFRAVPPAAVIAPAPFFGSSRSFSSVELHAIAARFNVTESVQREFCFSVPGEALDHEKAIAVMRQIQGFANARIQILETSAQLAPAGVLELDAAGLGIPSSMEHPGPVIWRGNISYGAKKRYSVWFRIQATASLRKPVAAEVLKAGVAIQPGQVRDEVEEAFPLQKGVPLSADEITGMVPLRSIAAGEPILAANLTRPNDIRRGDSVRVEVRFGGARLALTGRAETAGRVGEMIAVRNPESNRIFHGRIETKDLVVVAGGHSGAN